jgi:cytochrome c5
MKKAIGITFATLGILFLTSMFINHSTAQSSLPSQKDGTVSKPIAPGVMKIAERSCVKCHTEGGNGMALMHLNLSNWDKFSPEKQAGKAKDMCKMVSKGKMPPKGFREKNPGAAPTEAETKIICDWATSIQIPKK